MKKIIAPFLILIIALSSQAQVTGRKMHPPMKGQHPMLHQKMELSEEQKSGFRALNDAFRKNMIELRKKDDITVKEWKSRKNELKQKHRADLQNLFSPEQKDRIKRMNMQRNRLAHVNARARMNRLNIRLYMNPLLNENRFRLQQRMPGQMKSMREHQLPDMQKRRMELMRMYRLHRPGKLS